MPRPHAAIRRRGPVLIPRPPSPSTLAGHPASGRDSLLGHPFAAGPRPYAPQSSLGGRPSPSLLSHRLAAAPPFALSSSLGGRQAHPCFMPRSFCMPFPLPPARRSVLPPLPLSPMPRSKPLDRSNHAPHSQPPHAHPSRPGRRPRASPDGAAPQAPPWPQLHRNPPHRGSPSHQQPRALSLQLPGRAPRPRPRAHQLAQRAPT
jgi:hypothetical protein